jgi:SAM-dependent methyltransferase
MKYHEEIGVSTPEWGWVPSPTYILRRDAILRAVADWEPGALLEVGCGSGSISYEMARRGFRCVAVEMSGPARELAARILRDFPEANVVETPPKDVTFDYMMSFEVLEHIKDDAAALRDWVARLRVGGRCLLSVPAHRRKWNVTDVSVGHYRRYDRADIISLVESSGLEIESVSTYGWPFTWVIEKVRLRVKSYQLKRRGIDPAAVALGDTQLTEESGIQRDAERRLFPWYGSWAGRKMSRLACRFQFRFMRGDRGISYLVKARNPSGRPVIQ